MFHIYSVSILRVESSWWLLSCLFDVVVLGYVLCVWRLCKEARVVLVHLVLTYKQHFNCRSFNSASCMNDRKVNWPNNATNLQTCAVRVRPDVVSNIYSSTLGIFSNIFEFQLHKSIEVGNPLSNTTTTSDLHRHQLLGRCGYNKQTTHSPTSSLQHVRTTHDF
jgi:hypothetical protein